MKKTNSKKSKKNKAVSERTIMFKHIFVLLICAILIIIALVFRLAWLQFVDGPKLKEAAYNQQTINKLIAPKRGNIYDANGKTLAISASVDTISINPSQIEEDDKEKVAEALSRIFDLEYSDILQKVNSTSSVVTIAKKVEKDKVTELTTWMEDNKITTGINIDKDTKRYYPYSDLASN